MPTRVLCSQSGCEMPYWDGNSGAQPLSRDTLLLLWQHRSFWHTSSRAGVTGKGLTLVARPQRVKSAAYLRVPVSVKSGAPCPKEQTANPGKKLLLQQDRSCYGKSIFLIARAAQIPFFGAEWSLRLVISFPSLPGQVLGNRTNTAHRRVTAVTAAIVLPGRVSQMMNISVLCLPGLCTACVLRARVYSTCC